MNHLPASVGLLPDYAALAFGDRPALVGERVWSFNQIATAIRSVASALIESGVNPGDRVTLCGQNGWQWVVGYHAALRAGAVINPVNPLLTGQELGHIVQDCGANVLIVSPDKREMAESIERSVTVIDYDDLSHALDRSPDATAITPPSGLAAICYTSGTTGRPKGAMLSHRAVLANIALSAIMHGKGLEDRIISALPCAHVYGNVVTNSIFVSGASLELHARFDAVSFLDAVENGATMIEGVPTMYAYLLCENLEDRNLSSLRLCTVGGQTMPLAKMDEVQSRLGCPLVELWGMTELAGLGTTQPWRGPRRLGSIGGTLPFVEAAIDAEPGHAGELLIRGPIVMDGYWNDPQATAEAITADGWLRTGDIATRDPDGFIFVVDRKKDMILTAGYNIYPAELERVIAEHPAILLVAVAGIPDELKGEIPCAWVVLKPGCGVEEYELLDHCRAQLAAYKIPRRIVFADDLPKTSTGKIMRSALREIQE